MQPLIDESQDQVHLGPLAIERINKYEYTFFSIGDRKVAKK